MSTDVDFAVSNPAPSATGGRQGIISVEEARAIVARYNEGQDIKPTEKMQMYQFFEDKVKGMSTFRDQKLKTRGIDQNPDDGQNPQLPDDNAYPFWRPE